MKDPFSYSDRCDSVGLDCSVCVYGSDVEWPNIARDYACNLHRISLTEELGANGYKEGEWFCSAFSNNGKANVRAVEEFEAIKHALKPDVLYGAYGSNNQLKEIAFAELQSDT